MLLVSDNDLCSGYGIFKRKAVLIDRLGGIERETDKRSLTIPYKKGEVSL